ncbi:hypothetical protein [Natronorubrum sp. DTA7]|uniref:hypothetical protein n=1 Tax=Natronorubrum sp. DTA7 TaxID=3447016 RepID=UPI003F87CF22
MTTIDAITLIDRDDGTRSMKLGRHDGDTYLEDQAIKTESAEIVELEDPVSKATILANWATSDFPERVREFFGVDETGSDDQNQQMEAVQNV